MDGVKDHVLALVAAGMAGDDLATTADHNLVHIAPHPDIKVAIGDGHQIIVGLVAHQRLRTHPPARLIAGIKGCRRQFRHHIKIPLEPLSDRLGVAMQDVRLTLAALRLQPEVEVCPGGKTRQRHHEVTARPADKPLDATLVVPLAGPAVAVTDHVMRQKPAE